MSTKMANKQTGMAPSIDSTTTTPAVSVHGNNDPEKGLPSEKKEAQPVEKSVAAGPAPSAPAIGPPPDGGAQAWLVVLGAFCGLFVSFGWINCKYCQNTWTQRDTDIIQASESSKHTIKATN